MMDESKKFALAIRGAMYSPDPFTAFQEIELSDMRAKPKRKKKKKLDSFSVWLIERYSSEE
jgi:hypothetical protein